MPSKKPAPSTPPRSIYVPLRMPTELHTKVETHRQALSQAAGGAEVAFSFAVFHLVQAGLDTQNGAE
jgi:hypothetical protein